MLFSELKCKDVINMRDCRKLGRISDLEFDQCSGQICKVFIPGNNKFWNLLCNEPDICIPYRDIKQIGPDIIIVDIKC
ncbi:MAG: YlmC/YmxH family sporulation protein [Clostridium sp.]|nr:YlmC/YmxH family sporulation protein [Clostridium sp.]